jgi:hypothetical protein
MQVNTIDFCISILYPATLMNLCISCNRFLLDSLGFSLNKFILYTNDGYFIFPLNVFAYLLT